MIKEGLLSELKTIQEFFERSTSCLDESDSGFAPKEGMYTVASHVAHTGLSVDWFIEGMFDPKGFDMNFEAHIQKASNCKSLTEARNWCSKAFANAIETIGSKTDEELQQPLPKETIMGGAPRLAVIGALSDHTAHHRGSLCVYTRLLDKVPPMPYGDM